MYRRRGRSKVAVALIATALVASGCSGDPEPIVTELPSMPPVIAVTPTPTPTPSPSATELTDEEVIEAIPPLARQEDFVGAQEFAKFFLAEYNRMWQDGDDALYAALSTEECDFCELVRQDYLELRDRGESTSGGSINALNEDARGGLQDDGNWGIELDIEADPLTTFDSTGSEIDVAEGGPGIATVILEYDAHWRVLAIGAEPS